MRSAMLMLVSFVVMTSLAAAQPQLAVQGEPYFGGDATLTIVDASSVGQPVFLALGLNPLPLDAPLMTGKGPFYIGLLVNSVLLGVVPSNGTFQLDFTMPSKMPALVGIPIVLQGFLGGLLSNPAVLPLDEPYYLSASTTMLISPLPEQGANFGDVVIAGDLNDDGSTDLVVNALYEDFAGVTASGRVYVLWGPDYVTWTALASPVPKWYGAFGDSLTVADLDGDLISDLLVGEAAGGAPASNQPGFLYVYKGGPSFSAIPTQTIPSTGTGLDYNLFGRHVTTGDYNHDLSIDIAAAVVDAPDFSHTGRIDVYWGPTYTTFTSVFSPDPASGDYFGSRLATGDVNGDGVDDLLESSGREDIDGTSNIGRLHAFVGPALSPLLTIDNPLPDGPNSRFGDAIVACDLNGDSIDDIVSTDQRAHVYVFWSPGFTDYLLIDRPPTPGSQSGGTGASFGYFVAVADSNTDGIPDILIPQPYGGELQGCSGTPGGQIYVSLGPYYSTFHVLHDSVQACSAEFGWNATYHDMVGNGVSDVLSGAPTAAGGGHVTVTEGGAPQSRQ